MDEVLLEAGSRNSGKLVTVLPTVLHGVAMKVLRSVSVSNRIQIRVHFSQILLISHVLLSTLDYNIASKISGFTSLRDEHTKTQYAYSTTGFLSYDDERAVCDKTEYALDRNLSGYIIWEISGDLMPDLSTPLLDATNNRLNEPNVRCGSVSSTTANGPLPPPPPQPSAPMSAPNLDWPSVENEPAEYSKPTQSPTKKATTSQAAAFASLFYPDFKNDGTPVGCRNDGNAPKWITNDMMRSSRADCCSSYFSPTLTDRCNTNHPYYPSFENQSCINDGNHPSWMAGDYLADSKWACCRNVFRGKKMLEKCTSTPQ
jgi:hypothetical protein